MKRKFGYFSDIYRTYGCAHTKLRLLHLVSDFYVLDIKCKYDTKILPCDAGKVCTLFFRKLFGIRLPNLYVSVQDFFFSIVLAAVF